MFVYRTCKAKPFLPINEFKEPGQTDRITFLKYNRELLTTGFDVAPMEFKNFFLKEISNPILWFRGQLLKYIWRKTEKTLYMTNLIVSRIPFECGPVVGIHVRRTDKYREAKLQKLEDYLKLVDIWFDVNERNYQNNHSISSKNCTNKRMLFVASDTPVLKDVVKEVKNKVGNKYEIYHAKIFNKTQYFSKESFIEILAVYRILAKCQFLVCTLSSHTCLMTYELMHALQGDANEKLHSLDYLYSQFYLQNEKDSSMEVTMEATTEYKPIHGIPQIIKDKDINCLAFAFLLNISASILIPFDLF
uniref:GT23 domain-containing protein n=1 Tax=Meloidogyne enterolobii TaxID=390850 RepID=A0A6V7TI93_MELEN|nr:unnamed protein product [Meloidogyne enterolobii]